VLNLLNEYDGETTFLVFLQHGKQCRSAADGTCSWYHAQSVHNTGHQTHLSVFFFTLGPLTKHHQITKSSATTCTHAHTHTRLTALFPGLPKWAGTRKGKSIWILLKHETVSGSGISWAMCKSAHHSRQITTPAPHHSVFYRLDALPAAQPTASKHWRQKSSQACSKL